MSKAKFDPASSTVEEVLDHLKKNPEERERILEAENGLEGGARSTLVAHLAPKEKKEKAPDVPVPTESSAVTVDLEPTPTVRVGGRDYTLTPDGGYRAV